MKHAIRFLSMYGSVFMIVCTMLCLGAPQTGRAERGEKKQESRLVRAKIGIQILRAEKTFQARAKQSLKSTDNFRLYIVPQQALVTSVVLNDGSQLRLLQMNMTQEAPQKEPLILPSEEQWYSFDANSSKEYITIICSPEALAAIQPDRLRTMSQKQWTVLQQGWEKSSNALMTDEPLLNFAIAGNVRSLKKNKKTPEISETVLPPHAFVEQLDTFSGRNLLIKTYAFKINGHKKK